MSKLKQLNKMKAPTAVTVEANKNTIEALIRGLYVF